MTASAQVHAPHLPLYLELRAALKERGEGRADVYAMTRTGGRGRMLGLLKELQEPILYDNGPGVYCVLHIGTGDNRTIINCYHCMPLPKNIGKIHEFRDRELGIIIVFPKSGT